MAAWSKVRTEIVDFKPERETTMLEDRYTILISFSLTEGHFIRDMHKDLFFCPPKSLEIWMLHFEAAIDQVDLGKRKAEVKRVLLAWAGLFGKSLINKTDSEIADYVKAGKE